MKIYPGDIYEDKYTHRRARIDGIKGDTLYVTYLFSLEKSNTPLASKCIPKIESGEYILVKRGKTINDYIN